MCLGSGGVQGQSLHWFGLRAAAACYTRYEGGSCVVTNSSATPWTVARQVPLPVEFSSILTGVGIRSHLQGIFPTQGWNPGLLHRRQILYCLSRQGSPKHRILKMAMVARSCIFFLSSVFLFLNNFSSIFYNGKINCTSLIINIEEVTERWTRRRNGVLLPGALKLMWSLKYE